jgi:signal recognition particle subunit SRP54
MGMRTKKVALISTDTWRPAAYDQLKQLGDKIEIQVFGDKTAKKPEEIYKKFKKELDKFEIVIIDSAGRDSLNKELVDEITDLNKIVDPTDTFLVMGADVGQTAQRQAEAFKDNLNVTGVIITKMDGTGKGGGALSACSIVEAPVRFIGVGEKTEDFERFNSEKFVSQLLGMGDIDTLLEKAKLAIDEDKARGMADRMMKGNFDLDDLYEQMGAMKKMGSMSKIMGMMPGMGGLKIDKSQMENQESKMKKWKFIMDSMTKYEKRNPEVIELSRIKRIAQGSGTQVSDLRELLKHFKQTKKMMTMLKDPGSMPDMDNMNPQEIMKMMKKSGMKDFKKLGKKK